MALSLIDRWIWHYKVVDGVLVVRHDAGTVRLPVGEISSHKHISFAHIVIRLFTGQRYDLAVACFRSDEISKLVKLLREIGRENRVRK